MLRAGGGNRVCEAGWQDLTTVASDALGKAPQGHHLYILVTHACDQWPYRRGFRWRGRRYARMAIVITGVESGTAIGGGDSCFENSGCVILSASKRSRSAPFYRKVWTGEMPTFCRQKPCLLISTCELIWTACVCISVSATRREEYESRPMTIHVPGIV